ncbi:unnamed protein product [Ectocarpus sp. 12 AP-2014]
MPPAPPTYGARRLRASLWTIGVSLLVGSTNIVISNASECLVGCTLMELDPFDTETLVEWNERGTCDDSVGCKVNTGDTSATWVGCGSADASRCLWAETSGTDGSSDCSCSVCGSADSSSSSYMSEYPTWTRIACFIAGMEAVGFDASVCVAAVVDDGEMACVDEPYETPALEQLSCPSAGVTLRTSSNCDFNGSLREAGEMFGETIGTFAWPTDDSSGFSLSTVSADDSLFPTAADDDDWPPSDDYYWTPSDTEDRGIILTDDVSAPSPQAGAPASSPVSTEESDSGDDGGKDMITEIIIGVVSAVVSGVILAVIKKKYF